MTGEAAAPSAGRRTADVLIDVLAAAGVEVVFGLPGGAIAPLHDALLDRPNIRVITTRHEAGAMFAAQAYARMTGKIGVVLVTSGPGILNAMTGLASAYCDGMPVVLLAGEVPRQVFGKRALQEGSSHHLDVITACKAIAKLALQIPTSDAAPAILQRAIATALSGKRGPVVLTLPLDLMSASIKPPRLAGEISLGDRLDSPAMREAIRATRDALVRAERPLIFAGSGARWGDGPARLRALAEELDVPVATTPKGKGVFPESHPLSLGVFGYAAHPSSTEYLEQGVDALLAVGTGLGDVATNGWSPLLRRPKHFAHVDIDALQIGTNLPVTHGIVGDAARVLEAMIHGRAARRRPRADGAAGVRRYADASREARGPEGKITPMRALWELQRAMPARTVYTCDIGEHLMFAIHYLEIDDPDGFLIMTGLGSMGASIASALGARLARPDRAAAAICGDGCFSMNLGDLAVAVTESIPIAVAVLNDERYGMVELGHDALFGRHPTFATPTDVCAMARSVGAQAVRVEQPGDVLEIDLEGRLAHGPIVLDVRIDRLVKMPKNGRFEKLRSTVTKSALN